jgi:peptidoglycan hydrolase-like protein with peptidoglycan-binding domain
MAQTTTSTSSSIQIQSLLEQIRVLQSQIQALQTAQAQLKTAGQNVSSTLTLIRGLRGGMTGDDVIALQTALASDPSIYPEGIVSGYFGNLTSKAVKNFQKKHGFEQVGFVGPKTLKKLNELFENLGLSEEDDGDDDNNPNPGNSNNQKRLCAKIPPGHLIAPGWLKKNNRPIVPECQKLPKGIEDKRDGDNNSNASTTPFISNKASASVVVGGTIYDTATLAFGNSPTGTMNFQVYGPWDSTCLAPISPAPTSAIVSGNGNYNSGTITATTTGTYRFIATYSGDSKNKSVSTNCSDSLASVNVTAVPDTVAPVFSSIGTQNLLGTTTSLTWTTNEASNSKVWFGTTTPVISNLNHSSTRMVSNGTLVTSHILNLAELATSTTYYFVVVSSDSANNTATSTENSFLTTAGL